MFNNLTNEGLEESQDRLGGFSRLETDAYTGIIKAAYAGVAAGSKAQSVTLIFVTQVGGKDYEFKETQWVTNKNGENFFRNKDDNTKKVPLPGYTVIDDICMVTTEKPISQQAFEDKVINVYDPDAKKEMPKSVPMMVELLGKTVTLGILRQTVNKQTKDSAGNYVDTPETRDENTIEKVFHHPSNLTMVEARNGQTTAQFYGAWLEKNKGVTRDKTNKALAGQGGKNGRPVPPQAQGNIGAAKTTSLFQR